MKHDQCSHERTPAGRAACRNAKGNPPVTSKLVRVADAPKRRRSLNIELKQAEARANAPEVVRKAAARANGSNRRADIELSPVNAPRDLKRCAVPDRLHQPIRFAWLEGWQVKTGTPYNDTQKLITITNDFGTLSLVWSAEDDSIGDVHWRAAGTSITRRVPDAPQGVALLQGS